MEQKKMSVINILSENPNGHFRFVTLRKDTNISTQKQQLQQMKP